MIPFVDWFPLLFIGGTFTAMGLLKVYGLKHKIVGGGGKPWGTRMRGSCPTWSKHLNVALTVSFLLSGLTCLTILGWLLLTSGRN